MIIRRLDVFFRTHLTLDSPKVFNSVTNFLFIPIQYVFGQNKYQSLQGKVTEVPKTPDQAVASTTLTKVAKVFIFFVAIIPTLIGIATRHLSFLSPDVDQAYSLALLSQLTLFELTPKVIEASFAFLRKKPEEERNQLLLNLDTRLTQLFLSQTSHQNYTNAFLSSLDKDKRTEFFDKLPLVVRSAFLETNQAFALQYLQNLSITDFNSFVQTLPNTLYELASKKRSENVAASSYLSQPTTPSLETRSKKSEQKVEPFDALLIRAIKSLQELEQKLEEGGDLSKKLEDYKNDPFYPFPFLLGESPHETQSKAEPNLWSQLKALCQSCSEKLTASSLNWDDGELQKTTRNAAITLIVTTAKTNLAFFRQLDMMLKDKAPEQVIPWLDQQRTNPEYAYPFHTQLLILTFWNRIKPNPRTTEFLRQIESRKSLLEQKTIPIEDPPSDHLSISRLRRAMDQLENIVNFEALVKPRLTS